MSWFSAITDTVASVSETVSKAIPLDKELLDKLTLNTDEMKATRDLFGEEAARKAAAKDLLAKMLPWDTKDAERDILVDECKEAILALSSNEATFHGPFEMPELDVKVEDEEAKKKGDGDSSDGDDEEDIDEEDEDEKRKRLMPSEESLEKLAQLEPLPPLLQDFDLECHVGLIQMILKEDPRLVEMQSTLSGGGKREEIFWRNYFFHCAYTRYEAGLSIDEIWSFSPDADPEPVTEPVAAPGETKDDEEEQVVFSDIASPDEGQEPAFQPDESKITEIPEPTEADAAPIAEEPESVDIPSHDFDFLDNESDMGEPADPELDELEAEILRELED